MDEAVIFLTFSQARIFLNQKFDKMAKLHPVVTGFGVLDDWGFHYFVQVSLLYKA
jgi:hypothetical protein